MKKDYMDACMNSVRQRILQVIIGKGEATSSEIGKILSDVPRASLYRHIKVLLDAGVIQVVREENKRGSVERTFCMKEADQSCDSKEEVNQLVQQALMGLQGEFYRYFEKEDPDPQRDMLTIGSASLMLTDAEMTEFALEYGKLLQKYIMNTSEEGRKVRKVTLVVSPGEL